MTPSKFASLAMLFFGLIIGSLSFAQNAAEAKIKVSGNCEMCKKTIEKAAKSAGASEATWDEEKGLLMVKFDASKTNADKIQKKVADAGYDTEKYKADDKAYAGLKKCCKYDRKK
jgi:mercuric ion binding protein